VISSWLNGEVAKVCLNKVLKEKNITKYRFAELLGEDSSNVTKYFKPGYNPTLVTLEKWAKVLKVSVKDLIED
jgi:transcriptional regulator with XRE-family HTH domain